MRGRRRRERWLNRRKRKGLARPLPLRRAQVNGQCATAGPDKTERIVLAAVEDLDVDVVTFCEVASIDVAKVLGRGWDVAQDTSSWARAGCAIAVRRSRGEIRSWSLRMGVLARLAGRRADRMQDRYLVRARVRMDPGTRHTWTYKPAAGHGPPKRNWFPWWGAWVRAVKTLTVHDIGCDWNRLRRAVQEVFPRRRVLMHLIDGFVVRRWIPAGDLDHHDSPSDHPVVTCTLWPAL